MNTPNTTIQRIAQKYNASHGLDPIIEAHCVQVNQERARRIACAFEDLPVFSEDAREAYTALGREVQEQWNAIFDSPWCYILEPWLEEGQPYANSEEMTNDLRVNRHLYFFIGGEPHPFLGQTDDTGLTLNDKFRAVHDFFGHAAEGFTFGPRGEENAWVHHSMMFSPLAQRALSTETRGQNSWVNFGPYGHLPVKERPYAIQKCALLPEELTDWREALGA